MATSIEEHLLELRLELPPVPPVRGLYAPARISGNLLYLSESGGAASEPGEGLGRLGRELTIEQGRKAAKMAVLKSLSIANSFLGRLESVRCVVKLLGFVSSTENFHWKSR
ncbi:MAG: RidA family protein [Rectinemataceae bacterium]